MGLPGRLLPRLDGRLAASLKGGCYGCRCRRYRRPVTGTAEKAAHLLRLHTGPDLLIVVNVWDVMSATVVAGVPGTKAIATASHSIAATFGYPDQEVIPRDLMIDMCGRIAAAVDLPVSADLEAGYGDAGETVRRAIGVGVVGANLEDEMRPLPEAVAAVRAAVAAGEAEGRPVRRQRAHGRVLHGG